MSSSNERAKLDGKSKEELFALARALGHTPGPRSSEETLKKIIVGDDAKSKSKSSDASAEPSAPAAAPTSERP